MGVGGGGGEQICGPNSSPDSTVVSILIVSMLTKCARVVEKAVVPRG